MNIIPIDATLIKGSHGRLTEDKEDYPIFISNRVSSENENVINAIQVRDLIEDHLLN